MSEKGYLVVEGSGAFYKFIESEPKQRRFIVDYFSKASSFAYRPEEETLDYLEYCKAAGWTHSFNNGKMQCFYTKDMETPEIETDDEFKFKSIIKAEISQRIVLWLLTIFYVFLEEISYLMHLLII